jgi:hypothetical protein
MDPKDEKIALFRYGLIAPLVIEVLAHGEMIRRAREIAAHEYEIPNPTSAGFGAESFVHAGLAFLSVTISGCLPRFDGLHDFVGDPENLIDLALHRIRSGSLSQPQRRSLGGW